MRAYIYFILLASTETRRICDTVTDTQTFLKLKAALKNVDLTSVMEQSGCYRNCKYTKYVTNLVTELDIDSFFLPSVNESISTGISMFISDPYIKVEEEKLDYDLNRYIADFGGFLGLLLGLNCIDIYVLILDAIDYIWNMKNILK